MPQELRDSTISLRVCLLDDIEKYISGKLLGDVQYAVEQRIFNQVARMKMSGVIQEIISS
jgi:hypothetical protein